MTADAQETLAQGKRYILQIKLDGGEEISASLGQDEERARAEFAALHARTGAEPFIRLGETAVVRTRDIRSVQLYEEEANGSGLLDSLKSRVGGEKMSTYGDREQIHETETRTAPASRATMRGGRPHQGPGFGEQYFGYGSRPWAETKPFFLTTEFLTLIGLTAAIAIAMAVSDVLDADRGWLLITILGVGYMISRGLAKAGTRDPNPQDE